MSPTFARIINAASRRISLASIVLTVFGVKRMSMTVNCRASLPGSSGDRSTLEFGRGQFSLLLNQARKNITANDGSNDSEPFQERAPPFLGDLIQWGRI